MFSNFRKAFVTRPQFTIKTPSIILENAAKALPKDFCYVDDSEHPGVCYLDCAEGLSIKPDAVAIKDNFSEVFKNMKTVTVADLQRYCYNSQSTVELLPDDNGNFLVNGETINISQFVITPLKESKGLKGKLKLVPPKFPPEFTVVLCGNGTSMELQIKRQPNHSLYIQKYSSTNKEGLQLNYTFDDSQESGTMRINLSILPSSKASTVLKSHEVLNAFLHGNGTMCGFNIHYNGADSEKEVSDRVLALWKKVVAIEKTLSIEFNAAQQMEFDDVKYLNILYRCFVEKKPYKEYLKDSTLTGNIDGPDQEVPNTIGTEMALEFVQIGNLELLDRDIKINALNVIFDGIVAEHKIPPNGSKGEYKIKLISAPGKKMYASKIWFIKEEDLDTFKKNGDYFSDLQNAQELEI